MCGLGWFFCACQGLRKIVFARDGTSKLEAEAELEHTVGLTIWVSLGKEIEQFLDLHFDLVPHTTELGEVPRIDGRWVVEVPVLEESARLPHRLLVIQLVPAATARDYRVEPLMIKVGHGVRGVARNVYPHLSHHGDGALFHRGPPDDPSAGNAYLHLALRRDGAEPCVCHLRAAAVVVAKEHDVVGVLRAVELLGRRSVEVGGRHGAW
mmetsp:Transcript_87551/g.248949  ORF Transcript_87551/g.248949 Transcript_87551/m.248949 type:complete len:209 (-) Transcript_87551:113-739(-)